MDEWFYCIFRKAVTHVYVCRYDLCNDNGSIFGIYVIIRKILHPEVLAGYSSNMAVLLLIGGLMMFFLGLIGEYIGRIYICINNAPQFALKDMINIDEDEEKKNNK